MQNLIIFIKNPIEGQVKTRLAAVVGDREALLIYEELLQITRRIVLDWRNAQHSVQPNQRQLYLYYSNFIDNNDGWDNATFIKRQQLQTSDLGERMQAAFTAVMRANTDGAAATAIIGSDCPCLSSAHIDAAFDALYANADLALGRATDGGYYLLAIKKLQPFLFLQMQWSNSEVAAETLRRAKHSQLTINLLEILNDIDTAADWQQYCESKP